MSLTSLVILLYQVVVIRPMILLQTPYGTKYTIVTNSLQIEMALLESTAIESGQQPEQGLVGLPEMKETTMAIGRGIVMFLIAIMVICFIQMQKLQAFFVLEVHASTALNQTVLSLKIGYWNMFSLTLPTQHMVWQLPNF